MPAWMPRMPPRRSLPPPLSLRLSPRPSGSWSPPSTTTLSGFAGGRKRKPKCAQQSAPSMVAEQPYWKKSGMFRLLIAVAIKQIATPSIIYNRLVYILPVKKRYRRDALIIGKLLRASATNPHGKLCARTRVMTGSNGNNAEDWTIRCDYLTTLIESVWYGIIDRTCVGSKMILRYSQSPSERLWGAISIQSILIHGLGSPYYKLQHTIYTGVFQLLTTISISFKELEINDV